MVCTQHRRTAHWPSPCCRGCSHCLLLDEARLNLASSSLETLISQDFGISNESVKNFFGCAGLEVHGHNAWMPNFLLTGARAAAVDLWQVWLQFKHIGCFLAFVLVTHVVSGASAMPRGLRYAQRAPRPLRAPPSSS